MFCINVSLYKLSHEFCSFFFFCCTKRPLIALVLSQKGCVCVYQEENSEQILTGHFCTFISGNYTTVPNVNLVHLYTIQFQIECKDFDPCTGLIFYSLLVHLSVIILHAANSPIRKVNVYL